MEFVGRIEKGLGVAGNLGYHTANLEKGKYENAEEGVFAGKALIDGVWYRAGIVVHSFNGKKKIEAHLLNFVGEIYDKEMKIVVAEKIRDFIYFANNEDLKKQIAADILFVENKIIL